MAMLLVTISARAAAESAARTGYNLLVLDIFGDLDLSRIYPSYSLMRDFQHLHALPGSATEKLYLCSKDLDFTEVVYGSGFENHPELVEGWVSDGKAIFGNSARTLRRVRDWEKLFEFLASEKISFPPTRVVDRLGDLDPGFTEEGEFLVKPLKSGGGHGIARLDQVMGSPGLLNRWRDRPALVQRLVPGIPASLSFVCNGDQFLPLSTTRQLVGSSTCGFRYGGNIAPLDVPNSVEEEMLGAARLVAREYELVGCNGIDFAIRDDHPYLLEVNPRIQGSLEVVEGASGLSVFDLHVRACRGQGLPRKGERAPGFWGRKVVYAPADLVASSSLFLPFVKDRPRPGTRVKAGSPLCTVTARESTMEGCRRSLQSRENRVISTSLGL